MLKANNLTISVPYNGCNKNCPYCISKMTGYIEKDESQILRNMKKVKKIANTANISSVLITGKGEPLLSEYYTNMFIEEFQDYPLELQTNGIELINDKSLETIIRLYKNGLDVLALSFDEFEDFEKFEAVMKRIKNFLILRITFNVTSKLANKTFKNLLEKCKEHHVDQLTLRKIISPNNSLDFSVANWIEKFAGEKYYNPIIKEAINEVEMRGTFLRSTNFGTKIYDLDGVSFSHSEYCIQENNNSTDIRSLIFMEDGHLYTSWGSKASILF